MKKLKRTGQAVVSFISRTVSVTKIVIAASAITAMLTMQRLIAGEFHWSNLVESLSPGLSMGNNNIRMLFAFFEYFSFAGTLQVQLAIQLKTSSMPGAIDNRVEINIQYAELFI